MKKTKSLPLQNLIAKKISPPIPQKEKEKKMLLKCGTNYLNLLVNEIICGEIFWLVEVFLNPGLFPPFSFDVVKSRE